jgi:hypothetical protein
LSNPEETTQTVGAIYIKQYHQASGTPFGSSPLADIIGRNGNTLVAKALLEGTLPAAILSSLLPEMVRLLQTLATVALTLPTDNRDVIADEEFIFTYKVTSEATSSSPSGHHAGHYKAIVNDPSLVFLHASMISIPFQAEFAPAKWSQVPDIMPETDPGNSRCNR